MVKSYRTGLILFLSALCLLIYPVSNTHAQTTVQIFDAFCSPDFDPTVRQMPDEFEGTYYATMTDTYINFDEPIVINRYTQSTVASIQSPVDLNDILLAASPALSPDGRLLVYRAISDDGNLLIWDIVTDEIAFFTLPAEFAENLFANPRQVEQHNQKMVWTQDRQLTINLFDVDAPGSRLLSSLDIAVTTDPLSLTQGQIIAVIYPDFPVPETDTGTVSYFSPSGRYLTLVSHTGFVQNNIRIYDLQMNNALVFEQQPTEFITPRYGSPLWSPDENSFIYVENHRNNNDETIRNTLVQVDVLNNFQIDRTIDDILINTFGSGSSHLRLSDWSNDSEVFVFRMHDGAGNAYIAQYIPQTQELRAYCDSNRPNGMTRIIWSPDNRFVGYWWSGAVFVVDTLTGEPYSFPNGRIAPFIAWLPVDNNEG